MGQSPDATTAALPEDEPPVKRRGSCGLRGVPVAGLSPDVPSPISTQLVLPTQMAPASSSAATIGWLALMVRLLEAQLE
jgi:hypothetical protein